MSSPLQKQLYRALSTFLLWLGVLQVFAALSKLEGPGLLACAARCVVGSVGMVTEAHRHEPNWATGLTEAYLHGVTMWLAEAFVALPSNKVRSPAGDMVCQCGPTLPNSTMKGPGKGTRTRNGCDMPDQALLTTWTGLLELPNLLNGEGTARNLCALMQCFERCIVACVRQGECAKPLLLAQP